MKRFLFSCSVVAIGLASLTLFADQGHSGGAGAPAYLLRPARVFDGETLHEGWVVVVHGPRIDAAGPAASVTAPAGAQAIDLPGATLMPGLIDAHAHILLHAYNETPWNDQVLKEPESLRVARAVIT